MDAHPLWHQPNQRKKRQNKTKNKQTKTKTPPHTPTHKCTQTKQSWAMCASSYYSVGWNCCTLVAYQATLNLKSSEMKSYV